jgi:hypothetical protein
VTVSIRNVFFTTLMLIAATRSMAAEPVIVNGELIGATGITVFDRVYDVEFIDGSCVGLFNGCDDDDDFPIPIEENRYASAAADALLEQVFLDNGFNFDSQPELTRGCESSSECQVYVPYGLIVSGVTLIAAIAAVNDAGAGDIRTSVSGDIAETDTTDADNIVYAVFSLSTAEPPPTPSPTPTPTKERTKVALKFSQKAEDRFRYLGKIRQKKTDESCWPDRRVTIFHDKNSNEKKNKGETVIGKGFTNDRGRYAVKSDFAPPSGDTVSVIIKKNEECKTGRNSRTLNY